MKDVFDKSCISQASIRNSTMKLSQPLKRTNYGQHCISFLATSVWNNLQDELKHCTNVRLNIKLRNAFTTKWDRKITISIFRTRLFSSQQLMHFFFNVRFSFFLFFVILSYLSLPTFSRTAMEIKQLECFLVSSYPQIHSRHVSIIILSYYFYKCAFIFM